MGNRLTRIYTRTGDTGSTGLADGTRLDKDTLRIQLFGELDELNSHIGVVLAQGAPGNWRLALGKSSISCSIWAATSAFPGAAAYFPAI